MNPILQVTHARGGQYKYSGHTIIFPQDIISIVKTLPHRIEYLDILIIRREGPPSKHYDCIVSRSRVMDALHYKIRMDKYYRDVEVDPESLVCLPEQPTHVSSKLLYINSDIADSEEIDANIDRFGTHRLETHPSSFTSISLYLYIIYYIDEIIYWPQKINLEVEAGRRD